MEKLETTCPNTWCPGCGNFGILQAIKLAVEDLISKGTLRENIVLDDNPANQLMVNIFCAFADFERAVIRERTLAGLSRAKSQGKTLGYPKGRKRTPKRGLEMFRDGFRLIIDPQNLTFEMIF